MSDVFDTASGAEQGPDGKIPRDQWGRYKLPHPETGQVAGRTRVTTFAKSISDTYTLSMWSQRMAIKGITLRPDLAARVHTLAVDTDRDELNQIAEAAKDAANARAAANLGTAMHAFAERMDRAVTPLARNQVEHEMTRWPQHLVPMLQTRQQALIDHRIETMPEYIERVVYVPEFDVAGTFDRLVMTHDDCDRPDRVPNTACDGHDLDVLDDKTGRDLTYGWTEIAIQLALYANASHVLNLEALLAGAGKDAWEPMPPTRKDRGIVVHMPVAGADAGKVTLHEVDLIEGWEAAKLCAAVRAWRKRRNLAKPLTVTVRQRAVQQAEADLDMVLRTGAPDEVVASAITSLVAAKEGQTDPSTTVSERIEQAFTTREPTWEEKLRACSSRGELSRVWKEATAKGEWSAELERIGKDQLSKIKTL